MNEAGKENVEAFSIDEKMSFFKKKWLKEHIAAMCLAGILILSVLVAGILLKKPLIASGALIMLVIAHAIRNNAMMAYAEKNTFE
ncbi:MAG: hypothetical protein E7334_05735 [Clostridiales bacterium]|nr:hypothetical protein [Clostridiales bacterium]